MPRQFQEEGFLEDFADEATSQILIQTFIRNDGYKDIYGEGITYDAHVQYEVRSITKADGTLTATTMQVYLAGNVVITNRDKITAEGVSPKIIKVAPDADEYGIVVYT